MRQAIFSSILLTLCLGGPTAEAGLQEEAAQAATLSPGEGLRRWVEGVHYGTIDARQEEQQAKRAILAKELASWADERAGAGDRFTPAVAEVASGWITGSTRKDPTTALEAGSHRAKVAAWLVANLTLVDADLPRMYWVTGKEGENVRDRAEALFGLDLSAHTTVHLTAPLQTTGTLTAEHSPHKGTRTTREVREVVNPQYVRWLDYLEEAEKRLTAAGGALANTQTRAPALRQLVRTTYVAVEGSYVRELKEYSDEGVFSRINDRERERWARNDLESAQQWYNLVRSDEPPKTIRRGVEDSGEYQGDLLTWTGIAKHQVTITIDGKPPLVITATVDAAKEFDPQLKGVDSGGQLVDQQMPEQEMWDRVDKLLVERLAPKVQQALRDLPKPAVTGSKLDQQILTWILTGEGTPPFGGMDARKPLRPR